MSRLLELRQDREVSPSPSPNPSPSLAMTMSHFTAFSSPRSHRLGAEFTDSSPKTRAGNLESSSSSSFFSSHHGSSTRILEGEGLASGVGGARRKASPRQHRSNLSSFTLEGFGDFEAMESRLQKALDSPSLLVLTVPQGPSP